MVNHAMHIVQFVQMSNEFKTYCLFLHCVCSCTYIFNKVYIHLQFVLIYIALASTCNLNEKHVPCKVLMCDIALAYIRMNIDQLQLIFM